MSTAYALIITFLVILIGWMLLKSTLLLTELITHRKISLKFLFFNFKQKMWMTFGLGTIFLSLYLFLLFFSASNLNAEDRLALFLSAYQNPAIYAYRGLFFFVAISITIYLVRKVIISLYNSKHR